MKLIAITGKTGHGKTTVANVIKEYTKADIISFADPIRETLKMMYPILTSAHFTSRILKETPMEIYNNKSPRELMIWLGESAKAANQDVWVEYTANRFRGYQRTMKPSYGTRYLVIDDLRFSNELAWVRKVGGCVIHLEREEPELTITQKIKNLLKAGDPISKLEFDASTDFSLRTDVPFQQTLSGIQKIIDKRFDPQYEL
jgi:hypothetical protein